MKEFTVVYILGDKTKKKVTYEATTKTEAKKKAMADGFNVVKVNENIGAGLNQLGEKYIPALNKLKPQQMIDFFTQLAFMLESEIRMERAIKNMYRGAKHPQYRKFLNRLIMEMEQGNQLSYSLRPEYGFEREIKLQVAAGEKSGNVVDALKTIIQRMEMDLATRSKITKQLYYPAVVILIMVLVVNYILTNVVPGLAQVLIDNGGELPAITVFLINVSNFAQNYSLYVFLIFIALAIVFFLLKRNKITGVYVDRALLKLPVIGDVIMKSNLARYYYVSSNMLKGNLFLITSLQIAAESLSNKYIRQRLLKIPVEMDRSGKQIDELMRDIYITNDYAELVSTGLQTGKLSEMLEKISETTLTEANDKVKVLVTMIEPAITMVLGVCVATLVLALFMPMFALIDTI